MTKGELLYEGKAKQVFATDDPALLIQRFKDDATAFDGTKKSSISDKGVVNNAISSQLLALVDKGGVKTHFVRQLDDRKMLIRSLDMFLVEVVMRNVAAGSICRRYGTEEGITFDEPILELFYKSDPHHDPLMNREHVIQFGLCTAPQLDEIETSARRVNEILSEFFTSIGITLVDFKLEFGIAGGEIMLGDEISPDTCRLWDSETGKKLDKDRFRFDLGDVEGAYQEMLARVTAGSDGA